jgi:ribosome maturation factor RimP
VIVDRIGAGSGASGVPGDESVTIEDCQRVSQDLGALLDVDEALDVGRDRRYTLEVSSPGLDRPLRGEADYRRFVGRLAKVVTIAPVDGQTSFAGRLAGVEDGAILVTEGRKTRRVPFGLVKRARLEVEF